MVADDLVTGDLVASGLGHGICNVVEVHVYDVLRGGQKRKTKTRNETHENAKIPTVRRECNKPMCTVRVGDMRRLTMSEGHN